MFLRRLLPAIAAIYALVVFLPGVRADAAADARKAIQAATDREDAAVQKKDLQHAFAACAPDFRASDGQGHTSNVAQLKEQMQVVFGRAQTIKVKNTLQKITLKGDQATVTMAGRTDLIMPSPKGKPFIGVVSNLVEEIWVKSGTTWLRKSARLLTQKLTRDGKPVAGP
jgi:hypothetical protein